MQMTLFRLACERHVPTCVIGLWLVLACLAAIPHALAVPPAVLAREAAADIDPMPFWISEKFDGVRALWDGEVLRFRSGRVVQAPAWFIAALPPVALDGELWLGRGRFAELSGMVRKKQPIEAEWRQVRYMIFELPGAAGDFSARVAAMRALVAEADVAWLEAVEQFRLDDNAALALRLEAVIADGGEGLMLHRADSHWHAGRSDALLKLKPWQDAEAQVVAHLPGTGRLAGMLGALEVEMDDGRRFRIGTGLSDAQRRDPPPLGAQITFRYRGLTRHGLPRFASFWRVREPL